LRACGEYDRNVRIRPFEIERFYDRWEFRAELMLSSSDCESMAVAELLALEQGASERLLTQRLGYTEVAGSQELRAAIAALHGRVDGDDVLTLAAAEEGIFLAYHALVGPGDHVVVEAPCYGSAIEVARSTGAQVSLWQRRYEDRWAHDLDDLRSLMRANTRLIYVNSPHNPTGTQMASEVLASVIELCDERSTVLLSDEVYRGLEHDPGIRLPPACDLYERALSLNTVSKAYGLPGLRIGWLAGRDPELIAAIRELKLYTTICSSAPSETLVTLALRHSEQLVERARQIVLANLPLVDDLLERRADELEWVRPTAGPIGFPRVRRDIDVRAWCEGIAKDAGVLLLPGDVYEQPRHVRVGFGRLNLPQAVARLDEHLG
jgi:aspartate/methionine/tyrosine aminotransferase